MEYKSKSPVGILFFGLIFTQLNITKSLKVHMNVFENLKNTKMFFWKKRKTFGIASQVSNWH